MIWTETALMHDYGYFCLTTDKEIPLSEYQKDDYYLLKDIYQTSELSCINNINTSFPEYFKYSYDVVENYYKYKQKEKIDLEELNDHGIIGGCESFRRFCKSNITPNISPGNVLPIIEKIVCFTVASHNIFKSSDIEKDKIYKKYNLDSLTSNSGMMIDDDNKLLLLLSLVDTIECTKEFSRKENNKEYLERKTSLNKVFIETDCNQIVLDYTELNKYILRDKGKNSALINALKEHINHIEGLQNWTCFKVDRFDDYILCVTK